MSTQPELLKTKKKRSRRNYEKEMRELEAYIRAHIEVLSEQTGLEPKSDYLSGKGTAFKQVVLKIESYGGKNA